MHYESQALSAIWILLLLLVSRPKTLQVMRVASAVREPESQQPICRTSAMVRTVSVDCLQKLLVPRMI
jgi:hypothetical protein